MKTQSPATPTTATNYTNRGRLLLHLDVSAHDARPSLGRVDAESGGWQPQNYRRHLLSSSRKKQEEKRTREETEGQGMSTFCLLYTSDAADE